MGFRNKTSGYELARGEIVTPVYVATTISAAQDDTQLIAARSGFRIRVYSLAVVGGGASSVSLDHLIFRSIGSATSAVTASLWLNSKIEWPYHPNGWFETASGDGLFFSATIGQLAGMAVVAACIPA